ncbi:carbon storage regulator [Acutalibacter sp. JLR.KK004]|jgi:carbon storage regulator CsrA|uniref:carbon storage regulator n=1 Tax=Acutalibacter sp. JLR.KK004 TaxID=3112622 RepID=UPI002FF15DE0
MLTLRIKAGECITIGDNISVHVYRWRGDSVELAVNAPKEIAVRRKRVEEAPEILLREK